ncbi:MAG: DUF4468 domain-containing protein [Tannerellaceae bacterium]|nr:DUF4468 domain-containing protein [Tannerellaceae bacterium]
MKYTSILLLFIPFFLFAQNDTERNYLEGAVPEVNGKVVFTREMNLPGMSAGQIYDVVHEWASGKFTDTKNRIVYADKEKGDIAALGEEYIIFSSSALSLDRSLMSYRLTVECRDQFCKLSTTGIKYEYTVSYQHEPENMLPKNGLRINRHCPKESSTG